MREDRPQDQVTVVTTAHLSHTDDLRVRTRNYLITQAVRVTCVLLAVALPVAVHWKLLFIVGAVVLPWFGVVAANAGPSRQKDRGDALISRPTEVPTRIAIEPGRVIDGER